MVLVLSTSKIEEGDWLYGATLYSQPIQIISIKNNTVEYEDRDGCRGSVSHLELDEIVENEGVFKLSEEVINEPFKVLSDYVGGCLSGEIRQDDYEIPESANVVGAEYTPEIKAAKIIADMEFKFESEPEIPEAV